MTTYLETVNAGRVELFGFYSSNTGEVLLGELPPMPLDQFCDYATQTILAIRQRGDAPAIAAVAYSAGLLHEWRQKPRSTTSYTIQPKSPYTENPFQFDGKHVEMGIADKSYKVEPVKFVIFWHYVITGGLFGWDEKSDIIQESVIKAAKKVDASFESF